MSRTFCLIALGLFVPGVALSQGPVFLTPPNTTPRGTFLPSLNYIQKSAETDLSLSVNYGVRANFTVGVAALAIEQDGSPFQFARLQAQAKFRPYQKVGDGTRTVIGIGAGLAVPLGDFVGDVARNGGVTLISTTFSASHNNRRTGYMTSAQYTVDAHWGANRSTGTLGAAFSCRIKEAPPGVTGGPGMTIFTEGIGHWEANHSGWFAVAPGFVYRLGETQIKGGVRIPVQRWNSNSRVQINLSTSIFLRVIR